jgi:ribosomal protein S18 acetylase RimI-like enzyme
MKKPREKRKRLPPGVKIRSFRMADYEAVAEIWQQGVIGPDSREQIRVRLGRDRDVFLVAEVKGKPIGVVMGAWDGRRASVWRLAVHPDYRRRGVGKTLLRKVEERFRQKGAVGIYLLAWHENIPARSLYEACGFTLHPGVLFMTKEFPSEAGKPPQQEPKKGRRK